jgi:uncharacterized protein (DUF983 family)
MNNKPNILTSILTCKCPKCRVGDMFEKGNFFHPLRFHRMNKSCNRCGQSLEPEPGFYFGAMFVSYAVNTALFIGVWVLLSLFVDDYSLTTLLVLLGITVIAFLPLTYRISRSVWIAIFVPFHRDAIENSARNSNPS